MLARHETGLDGLPVEAVTLTGEQVPVYNIRVEEDHTYFIGRDEWGFSVWAHNICLYHGSPDVIQKGGLSLEEAKKRRKGGTRVDGIFFDRSNIRACGYARGGTVVRIIVNDAYTAAHAHPNPF